MASDSESYQADIENANSDDDDDDDNEDDNEDDDDSEDELANQAAGHYNRGVHYQESETTQNDDNNQDSANSDHWSPSEHQGESRTGRSAQTGAMLQPGGSTAKSTSAKPGVLAAVLKRLTTSSSARFGEFGPPQAKTRASKPKTRSASLLQQPSGSRGLGRSSSLQLKPLQRAGRRLDLAIVTKPRVLERFWWMYSLLMLVRAASIALPGYIHPDEFFQSPEVAARDVLELDSAFIPWEFANTETPSRSAVFPLLISGFPFALLKALFGTVAQIPPWALLIAPRIVMLFSSLVLDSQVLNAMRWLYPTQPALHATTLLVLASSFVTVVFHTRTFSNAMESVLLAALVGTLAFAAQGAERISLETPSANKSARRKASARPAAGSDAFVASVDVPPPSPSASVASPLALDTQRASKTAVAAVALLRTSSVVFGAVVVAGIFCRFTLVLFAAPLAVALQMLHYRVVCDVLVRRNGSVLAILSRLVRLSWIPLVASALLTTSGFVIFDSWYFGALEFGGSSVVSESIPSESPLASPFLLACLPTWNRLPVVAPLNNLLYNLNPANLEQHGLHPRYLHILVNMPLLFGPLVLALAAACCKFAFPPRSGVYQRCFILGVCGSAALGLLGLSSAPHQEPRFLLPLLLPIVLLTARWVQRWPVLMTAWIGFNLLAATWFGLLHQGAVTRSLLALNSAGRLAQPETRLTAIFASTYMPPRHLLAGSNWTTIDLGDCGPETLNQRLQLLSESVAAQPHVVCVVLPSILLAQPLNFSSNTPVSTNPWESALASHRLTFSHSLAPHISTEAIAQAPIVAQLRADLVETVSAVEAHDLDSTEAPTTAPTDEGERIRALLFQHGAHLLSQWRHILSLDVRCSQPLPL